MSLILAVLEGVVSSLGTPQTCETLFLEGQRQLFQFLALTDSVTFSIAVSVLK